MERTRKNARPGQRGGDYHKMSIDVPASLFVKLAALADERKIGIGPLMVELTGQALEPGPLDGPLQANLS